MQYLSVLYENFSKEYIAWFYCRNSAGVRMGRAMGGATDRDAQL